jgi:1-acyl-sn-glycerol-3-phosphate acyltransferase
MEDGRSILVFPGGGREVTKRRGEKYRLIWGERMGFARMAIECGYPIVPVASAAGTPPGWDLGHCARFVGRLIALYPVVGMGSA